MKITQPKVGCEIFSHLLNDTTIAKTPPSVGSFFYSSVFDANTNPLIMRTEFWSKQTIHLKNARKNWQRKRKKRPKRNARQINEIMLPGTKTTLLPRRINSFKVSFKRHCFRSISRGAKKFITGIYLNIPMSRFQNVPFRPIFAPVCARTRADRRNA